MSWRHGASAIMLAIRAEQMSQLAETRRQRFARRLFEHTRACWPREFDALTAAGVRAIVEHALVRAPHYGLSSERDIVRYLDTMMLLGRDFDVQPKTKWAGAILTSERLLPTSRMIRVWRRAKFVAVEQSRTRTN